MARLVSWHPLDVAFLLLATAVLAPLVFVADQAAWVLAPLLLIAPGHLLLLAWRPRRRISDDEEPLPEADHAFDPFEDIAGLSDADAVDEIDAILEDKEKQRAEREDEERPEHLGADVENRFVPPTPLRLVLAVPTSLLVLAPVAALGWALSGDPFGRIPVIVAVNLTVVLAAVAAARWYATPFERRWHALAGDKPDVERLRKIRASVTKRRHRTELRAVQRLQARMQKRERAAQRAESRALRRIERQLSRQLSKEEQESVRLEERTAEARRRETAVAEQLDAAREFEQHDRIPRLQMRLEREESHRIEEEERMAARAQAAQRRIEELRHQREVQEKQAKARAEIRQRVAIERLRRIRRRHRLLQLQAERLRFDWMPLDIVAAVLVSLLYVTVVGFGTGFWRAFSTYLFLLTVPGYLLVFAMWPERRQEEDVTLREVESQIMEAAGEDDVDLMEYRVRRHASSIGTTTRLALALGLSPIVTVAIGFLLHWTAGVTVGGLVALHLQAIGLFAAIGSWRWYRLAPYERWHMHFRIDEWSLGKDRVERGLTVAWTVLAVIAVISVAWIIIGPKDTSNTTLYVLGDSHEGACYPARWLDGAYRPTLSVTERRCPDIIPAVTVGISNNEGELRNYWIRAVWSQEVYSTSRDPGQIQVALVDEWQTSVPPSSDESPLTFRPQYEEEFVLPGPPPFEGKQFLSFQLFTREPPPVLPTLEYFESAHREVHFAIDNLGTSS